MHHYECGSAKRRDHSPEWMILSHVNCFVQGEVQWFQVLYVLHLHSAGASRWSLPVLQGKAVKIIFCGLIIQAPNWNVEDSGENAVKLQWRMFTGLLLYNELCALHCIIRKYFANNIVYCRLELYVSARYVLTGKDWKNIQKTWCCCQWCCIQLLWRFLLYTWYSLSNYIHDVHDVMKMAELGPRAL